MTALVLADEALRKFGGDSSTSWSATTRASWRRWPMVRSVPDPDVATHVVLVGLMGSGKTTVGKKVAKLLGWRFVDADIELEARSGRSVADWFALAGEDGFREAEADLLASVLGGEEPTVFGAGGGVVVTEANRLRLAAPDVAVVYLHGEPAFLASRAKRKPHRPLLGDDPSDVLEHMYQARTPGTDRSLTPPSRFAPRTKRARSRSGGWPRTSSSRWHRWASGLQILVPAPSHPARCARDRADRPPGRSLVPGARGRGCPAPLARGAARRRAAGRRRHPGRHRAVTVDPGRRAPRLQMPDGEHAKDLGTVEDLCRSGPSGASTAATCVVAVGGGHRHRHRRVRRRRLPPGSPSCTCRPRCSARSTPPSAARPA
jgi:shikimate kinase